MGRDLLVAAGWAVFIGGGITLGLFLGSLGADVPTDGEMLVLAGLLTGSLTLIVRVAAVIWRYRPRPGPVPSRPAGDDAPVDADAPDAPRVSTAGRGRSGRSGRSGAQSDDESRGGARAPRSSSARPKSPKSRGPAAQRDARRRR